MTALTLYTNPMSRGRIARWMLEETGQPYDVVLLDYQTTMRAPEYLAVNPMGKVPALRHGDAVVTECAAICAYLADAFPEAGLMPADRAAFFRWMFFAAGPLEQAVVNRALGVEVPSDKTRMVGYGDFNRVTDVLAAHLAATPYMCGPAFSAVDVYVGLQVGWGLQFGTLPDRPAFSDYWDRLKDRPAAIAANLADDALTPKE